MSRYVDKLVRLEFVVVFLSRLHHLLDGWMDRMDGWIWLVCKNGLSVSIGLQE